MLIGNLARRLVNGLVILLAAITFFLVPLGKKTMFQHLLAIGGTSEAKELATGLHDKGGEVAGEVRREVLPRVLPMAASAIPSTISSTIATTLGKGVASAASGVTVSVGKR
ncbi:MAG: hypothetical protein ACHREM_05100 [Polyangiales bacterium]